MFAIQFFPLSGFFEQALRIFDAIGKRLFLRFGLQLVAGVALVIGRALFVARGRSVGHVRKARGQLFHLLGGQIGLGGHLFHDAAHSRGLVLVFHDVHDLPVGGPGMQREDGLGALFDLLGGFHLLLLDAFVVGRLLFHIALLGGCVRHGHRGAGAAGFHQGQMIAPDVAHDDVVGLPVPDARRRVRVIEIGKRKLPAAAVLYGGDGVAHRKDQRVVQIAVLIDGVGPHRADAVLGLRFVGTFVVMLPEYGQAVAGGRGLCQLLPGAVHLIEPVFYQPQGLPVRHLFPQVLRHLLAADMRAGDVQKTVFIRMAAAAGGIRGQGHAITFHWSFPMRVRHSSRYSCPAVL